jgi:hypothetical protein
MQLWLAAVNDTLALFGHTKSADKPCKHATISSFVSLRELTHNKYSSEELY